VTNLTETMTESIETLEKMRMPKIERSQADLQHELQIQLNFMMKSCYAFDSGDISEAKRLSGSLRILLKDGNNSKSLIGMLYPNQQLVSYATDSNLKEGKLWIQHNFIVSTLMNPVHSYLPLFLAQKSCKRNLKKSEWLDEIIITDTDGRRFSRNRILLTMAEQDGGAHIDPKIEADYYALVKMNSQKSFFIQNIAIDPQKGLPSSLPLDKMKAALPPVWHSIRQMAHEVFESLSVKYAYDPHPFYRGLAISGIGLY